MSKNFKSVESFELRVFKFLTHSLLINVDIHGLEPLAMVTRPIICSNIF